MSDKIVSNPGNGDDDFYDDWMNAIPPDACVWNCRCIIIRPWIEEIRELLDEHVGNTEPRILEFRSCE